MISSRLLRAGLVLLPLQFALPAHALECPVSPNKASGGDIVANESQIHNFRKRLAAEDPAAATHSIISTLKVLFPKAKDANIANFMIALDCPLVAAKSQGAAYEKKQMQQFAAVVHDELAHPVL